MAGGYLTAGGKTVLIPKVIAEIEKVTVNNTVLADNAVAVVGDFDFLEQHVPTQVDTLAELLDLDPSSIVLKRIGQALYSPSLDDRVQGGPARVILVSPTLTTQAIRNLLDANAANSVKLTSRLWGPAGNRVRVSLEVNADDATLLDLTLERDGITESIAEIGSGVIATLRYTAGQATAMVLTTVPYPSGTPAIKLIQTKAAIAIGTLVPATLAFDGTLQFTPSIAMGAAETATVTVNGTNKLTGAADSEVLSWPNLDGAAKVTTKQFSAVTSIVAAQTGGFAGTFTLVNNAFNLLESEYPTLQSAFDRINLFTAQGFSAAVIGPSVADMQIGDLDLYSAQDVMGADFDVRADTWAFEEAANGSLLVEATRVGNLPPDAFVGTVFLSGGSRTAAVTADWTNSLEALEDVICAFVQCLTTTEAVQDELQAHLIKMAGEDSNPRQTIHAIAALSAKSEVLARAKALNSRHCSLAYQQFKVLTNFAGLETWSVELSALLLLGIHAGIPVGEASTRKTLRIKDTVQSSTINPSRDRSAFIRGGVMNVAMGKSGSLESVRSVTTWLRDKDPVYSEFSSVTSINAVTQDLAAYFDYLIGTRNLSMTVGLVKSQLESRAQFLKDANVLKDYDRNSIDAEDGGDYIRPIMEFAPVLPINWVPLRLRVRSTL